MKIIQLFLAAALLLSAIGCRSIHEGSSIHSEAIILACDQASRRVMLLHSGRDWSDPSAIFWAWSPRQDPTLNDEQRSWFENVSDAKPAHGGSQIVVTASSGGGAALIDVESGQAIATIYVGGRPHSGTMLPDGNIVIASSDGDMLSLWDLSRQKIIQTVSLIDAHGLDWDAKRNCLWALGGKQLHRYEYAKAQDTPGLKLIESIQLPITEASKQYPRHGGHDFSRIPGQDAYFVSDMDNLWIFDPVSKSFDPLPQRATMPKVKSISQLGEDGPILVLQATQAWYSTGPRLIDESRIWQMPGARIYKARWWTP